MNQPSFLLSDVVVFLHDEAVALYGGTPGIKNKAGLLPALRRAEHKLRYFDNPRPDVYDLAACYAYGITKNHAFHDGNKRTAWAACMLFLRLNGITFQASDLDKETKILDLATDRVSENDFALWLRENGCYEKFWADTL